MRKYQPIQNTGTIEIVQSNHDFNLNSHREKVVRDPKNQISPRVYKVIRAEKLLKISLMSISFIISFFSLIMFALIYARVGVFQVQYDGYLVCFGILAFVGLAFGFKNLIENIQWSHTVQRYREAVSSGDYTSTNTFHIAYRKIVLKDVNLTWLLIFVLTYLGLITLIIYGLYISKAWTFKSEALIIDFQWAKWMDRSFGNTIVFCIISAIVMASLSGLYVFIRLFDKKRLADINDFLGEKSVEIHEQIEKARKDRNKMWLRLYIVIVVLTILLPLALLCVALWRSFMRRRKAKT